MPARRDKYIRGLDVAMDNALLMSRLESVGDLDRKAKGSSQPRPQIFFGGRIDPCPESLPFKQLHHDERPAGVFVELVDRTNVGMIQSRSRARLALQALEGHSIEGDLAGQKVQGNGRAQPDVLGLIDHAHAAAAEHLEDAVMGDGLANDRIDLLLGVTPGYCAGRNVDRGRLQKTAGLVMGMEQGANFALNLIVLRARPVQEFITL